MRINRKSLVVVGTVAIAAAVWAAQDVPILVMDGRTVSSNLRQSDGTLMVPVRDLATAISGTSKRLVKMIRSMLVALALASNVAFGDASPTAPEPAIGTKAVLEDRYPERRIAFPGGVTGLPGHNAAREILRDGLPT